MVNICKIKSLSTLEIGMLQSDLQSGFSKQNDRELILTGRVIDSEEQA